MELSWGNAQHMEAARTAHAPAGFDVILGADLLYQRAALPLLFATCACLLGRGGTLLLACKPRNGIGEADYLDAARDAGLAAGAPTAWVDGVAVLQIVRARP